LMAYRGLTPAIGVACRIRGAAEAAGYAAETAPDEKVRPDTCNLKPLALINGGNMPEANATLKDKVVLITGASQGLGRALALAFAREGARVVVNARSEGSVGSVAGEVEDVERLVRETVARFGRIDVLVNNAGVLGPRVGIEEYPEDEWRKVLDANLTGTFLVSKAAIPHIAEGGSIINLVSGVSVEGRAEWGAYSVSKFGMEGLTQILSAELEGRGVRVNAVDPGGMRTDMRAAAYPEEDPQTRITPEENTAVFLYLASDESQGVTGQRFKAQEFGSGG
jgi:NAD(P)-dependent dehydrogenase (short-subunit alcohol dehydrogenase family)